MIPYSYTPTDTNIEYYLPIYGRSLEDGYTLRNNILELVNANGGVLANGYKAFISTAKRTLKFQIYDEQKTTNLDEVKDNIFKVFRSVGKLKVIRTDKKSYRWQWFVPSGISVDASKRKLGIYDVTVVGSIYPGWYDVNLKSTSTTAHADTFNCVVGGTEDTLPIIKVECISVSSISSVDLTNGGVPSELHYTPSPALAIGYYIYIDSRSNITYKSNVPNPSYPPYPTTELPYITGLAAQRELFKLKANTVNVITHNLGVRTAGTYRITISWYDYYL